MKEYCYVATANSGTFTAMVKDHSVQVQYNHEAIIYYL